MEVSETSTRRSCAYFSLQKLDGEVKGDTPPQPMECVSYLNPCRTHISRLHVDSLLVSEPTYHGGPTKSHGLSSAGSLPSSSFEHFYSICKKDDQTSFRSFQSPHRFIAHGQCRTQCSTAKHQGPDHNVSSETVRRTKPRRQCCYSKLFQLYRTTYSTVFGFLNGLILPMKRHSYGGISQIICLTILFAYLYLPLSHAAPQHKLRRLQTNHSRATEMKEVLTLLRKLNEQTSVREEQLRRGSTHYRRSTRRGRSGRRRNTGTESTAFPSSNIAEASSFLFSTITESPPLERHLKATLILEEIANSRCEPRDTLVDVFKEMNITRGIGPQIYPECVVVQRCQNGGCCLEHEECKSAVSEKKTFYFFQFEMESQWGIMHFDSPDTEIIEMSIRQDTSCVCQDKPRTTCNLAQADCKGEAVFDSDQCKCICELKCPEPFLQGDNCGCSCLMADRWCKNLFRGKRGLSLEKSQCRCVLEGNCYSPPCANGHFSKHECRCINSSS